MMPEKGALMSVLLYYFNRIRVIHTGTSPMTAVRSMRRRSG